MGGAVGDMSKKRRVCACQACVIHPPCTPPSPSTAVEYDYFPAHQCHATLETKRVPGLFFSGQLNGTTGARACTLLIRMHALCMCRCLGGGLQLPSPTTLAVAPARPPPPTPRRLRGGCGPGLGCGTQRGSARRGPVSGGAAPLLLLHWHPAGRPGDQGLAGALPHAHQQVRVCVCVWEGGE